MPEYGPSSRQATALWNLVFQALAILFSFANGIVLVPLYLRHIPSDLYGAWQASGNVLAWMTMLDPGLSSVLQQRVAAACGTSDTAAVSRWIATGFWITGGIAIAILAGGMASSLFLSSWMHLPPSVDQAALARAFRWSAAGSALTILGYSVTAANQGLQGSVGIGLVFVAASLTRLAMVVVLITSGFGLLAIAIPSVVMGLFLLVGHLACLRVRLVSEGIPWSWAPTQLREVAGLVSFTGMAKCASILANNVDLFLVARLLGPENVNVLRFTRTAPEMSRMFVERPFAAVQPPLAHLLGGGGVERAQEILLRMLNCAIWLLAGGFVVFNDDFLRLWVGDRFYAGTAINVLLIVWFLISVSTSLLSSLCFTAGNIRGNSLAGLAQVLIYLPMLWAGGQWSGMGGVVMASLLSLLLTQGWYLPRAFCRIYRVAKQSQIRLLKTAAQAGLAATVPTVLLRPVHPADWFRFGAWVAAFACCYVLLLFLLCSTARDEIRNGWSATLRLAQWRGGRRNP
jgi:O-antigen/teichoic acid export membrane protein